MSGRTIRVRGKLAPDNGVTDEPQGTQTSEIADSAVTTAKIAAAAVTAAKLGADVSSLTGVDNATIETNANLLRIKAGGVNLAKLAAGITPSHVVKFAGTSVAENDADATVTIALAGALATDVASAVVRASAAAVHVIKAVLTADTLTVTLSGNGGAGTQVDYVVYRAAA
jgi:hypothetical protein